MLAVGTLAGRALGMRCGGGDEETESSRRCVDPCKLPGNFKGFKSEFTMPPRGKPFGSCPDPEASSPPD